MTGESTSYAGRQLDMELLQHVGVPVDQRVYPAVDHDRDGSGPRICAGMEKVVQRYAKLLLTDLGSVKFDDDLGNDLMSSVRNGRVYSRAWLTHLFNEANRNVLNAMILDDNDTDTFGDLPDDERIDTAELVDLDIDQASATVRIHVRIVTLAGEEYEYIAPVASGIS
jgi:hypothetical protein